MQADAELERFVSGEAGRSPVLAVLWLATVLLVAMVLWPTRDELLAHFSREAPIDIPDATAVQADALPLGREVQLHGVLGNRAAKIEGWRRGSLRMGPLEVRQILGAPVFVEFDPALHRGYEAFRDVEVRGRVSMFGDDAEMPEVVQYLEGQGIEIPKNARLIVLDEGGGKMGRYVNAWLLGLALIVLSSRWYWRSKRSPSVA